MRVEQSRRWLDDASVATLDQSSHSVKRDRRTAHASGRGSQGCPSRSVKCRRTSATSSSTPSTRSKLLSTCARTAPRRRGLALVAALRCDRVGGRRPEVFKCPPTGLRERGVRLCGTRRKSGFGAFGDSQGRSPSVAALGPDATRSESIVISLNRDRSVLSPEALLPQIWIRGQQEVILTVQSRAALLDLERLAVLVLDDSILYGDPHRAHQGKSPTRLPLTPGQKERPRCAGSEVSFLPAGWGPL